MATETLILRPCDICKTISGAGAATHYPETNAKKHYLLLSEEQADDDASYIVLNSYLVVAFALPENHLGETPSSVKIYCRQKSGASEDTNPNMEIMIGYITGDSGSTSYNNGIIAKNADGDYCGGALENSTQPTTEYSTLVINVPSDMLSQLDFSTTNTHLFITTYYSGKGAAELRTTQMYVEITYDDGTTETTETIYLKENGSWTSVPCTIYQKQSGTWVITDSTIFENGNKYTFQEIT